MTTDLRFVANPPIHNQVIGPHFIVFSRFQQIGMDRHGFGNTHEAKFFHSIRVASRYFQRNQGSHGMSD